MTVAEFLIAVFTNIGIRHGFSVVGGMAMHLNRAASVYLDVIYCNHEQAVVAAADGYAKSSNFALPSLAIVTSGPGVSNTATALASAYYDSVPMFLVSGQVKSSDINSFGVRSYGPQEVPHSKLLSPITKLSFTYNPNVVSNEKLAENLALAMLGRKGPIHLDVPLDVQRFDTKSTQDVSEVASLYRQILDEDRAKNHSLPQELLHALTNAKRPLVVLGNGLRIASVPFDDVVALVDTLGIPALLTWASMDLLPHQHPLNFGCAGGLAGIHSNRILQDADVIVFLGTRLDLLTTGFNPRTYGKNALRFVLECDEAERAKFEGYSNLVALDVDVRAALKALCQFTLNKTNDLVNWLTQCHDLRSADRQAEIREFSEKRLTIYQVAALFSQFSETQYIVPTASGFAVEGFARFFKPKQGARFAWAGHVLGSMGLAIPSAIGAATRLGHCVICIDGDGGFLFNMQELYTLKANPEISVAIFVLNNHGYESIRASQSRVFNQTYGACKDSGLAAIDFQLIAKLADLRYLECSTLEQLGSAIQQIEPSSRMLVNVHLDEDDHYRGPSIVTKFDANGMPYSTALEDIFWR